MENVNPNVQNDTNVASKPNRKLGTKIGYIILVVLLLFIPTLMIGNLIDERESTASNAMSDVFMQWGGSQTVMPPILEMERVVKTDKNPTPRSETLMLLPNEVSIEGNVETKDLKRGIYEIVTMTAPISIKGDFMMPEEDAYKIWPFKKCNVSLGISDLKGISNDVVLKIGDKTYSLVPNGNGLFGNTRLSAKIDIDDWTPGKKVPFELNLVLKGSEALKFLPLGKMTYVKLTSNCLTPSFCGSFLPDHRDVSDKGFQSDWSVSYLNRSYPQMFRGDEDYDYQVRESSFGVSLLVPVQHYQKTTRCIKYAALFIILTFALFFFIEMIQKKYLHPIQYTLVGLGLVLFYALLLSFSEHIGFSPAYVVSSLMMIVMMTLYTAGMLKIRKTALYIGGALTGLYAYIFVLIQMETYALLAGSLGLFAILAVLMYFSQKINWERGE